MNILARLFPRSKPDHPYRVDEKALGKYVKKVDLFDYEKVVDEPDYNRPATVNELSALQNQFHHLVEAHNNLVGNLHDLGERFERFEGVLD